MGLSNAFAACPCAQGPGAGASGSPVVKGRKESSPAPYTLECDRACEGPLGYHADGTPNESRRGVETEHPPILSHPSTSAGRSAAGIQRGPPPAPPAPSSAKHDSDGGPGFCCVLRAR